MSTEVTARAHQIFEILSTAAYRILWEMYQQEEIFWIFIWITYVDRLPVQKMGTDG